MIALRTAQAVGGWVLHRESKADMNADFDQLEERISQSKTGLRTDISQLGWRLVRVETRLDSIEDRLQMDTTLVRL